MNEKHNLLLFKQNIPSIVSWMIFMQPEKQNCELWEPILQTEGSLTGQTWGIRGDGLIQGRKTDSLGPVAVSDMGRMGNRSGCYLVGKHESPSHCVYSPLLPPPTALKRRIWWSIVPTTKHPIPPTPPCKVFCPERQTGYDRLCLGLM